MNKTDMPDLRRLVDRIADILGPSATPERVEAIALAALEELGHRPAGRLEKPQLRPTGDRVVITAFGCDSPGILAEITRVVSEAECNVFDVSQKLLQGYFTLIMMAEISGMRVSLQELQRQMNEVGKRLDVRILVQHEELFDAMHRP